MKTILLAVMAFTISGCVATHERGMNESEKTVVSDQVLAMVDEAGGTLDIREKPEVYCKRIRVTGSHMVTRVCYTSREDEAMAEETKATYYRRFGQHNRSRDGN
ncbi:MAG: hypothetical protein AB8B96_12170 [Lysobacterales bacterium]